MKRPLVVTGIVVFCLAAAYYGVPRGELAWETSQRQSRYDEYFASKPPLVLDARTQAILSGADRVETFRLEDDDEDEDEPDYAASRGLHAQYLDGHKVLRVGPERDRAFAAALRAALAEVPSPTESGVPGDFMPGIGFRVWKGEAHVDVCASFVSNFLQVSTKDAHHKLLQQTMTTLGLSRPAFFTLSEQAFPNDSSYLRQLERM